MKSSLLIIATSLALGTSALAQQTSVQGNASSQSATSVSASKDGANATHSGAATANATGGPASAELAKGTELNATLTKPVDASKAKPGDEVTATLAQDVKSNGQVVAKKGSKLIGRVTTAQPLGKASGSAESKAESQLGIVFDRAVLKDGREVPINATVQALAASSASAGMGAADTGIGGAGGAAGSARSSGGGLVGGVAGGATGAVGGVVGGAGGAVHSGVGATGGVVGKSAGAVGGLNATGALSSGSKGVFGMKGVDIVSSTTSSANGSLITSTSRNIKLEGGTRMLLMSGASTDAAGATGAATASGAANAAGSVR